MNKQRRKQLGDIIDRVSALQRAIEALDPSGTLESVCDDLATLKYEEEEYKDNMPESMQSGEKYQTAEQAVSELEQAISSLETLRDAFSDIDFNDVTSNIDLARGAA